RRLRSAGTVGVDSALGSVGFVIAGCGAPMNALIFSVLALLLQVRAPSPPRGALPPAPRLADGTPNLGSVEPNKGYWAPQQFQDYSAILIGSKDIPFQPWAKALADYRKATQ